jgi:hypothetical protein
MAGLWHEAADPECVPIPLAREWKTQYSPFEFLHRAIGKTLALSVAGIEFDFFEALVTGNRRDLMRCRSRLGQRRGTSLAQTVSRAVVQVCLITPITHGVAKPGWCKGLAILSDEESQVLRPRRRNGRGELGMQRNVNLDRSPVFVFRLGEHHTAIANVLWTESDSIFAAATRVEEEIERQTRLAADQMPIAKLLDLVRAP